MAETNATNPFQHHPDEPDSNTTDLARLQHRSDLEPASGGARQVAETHHQGNTRVFNHLSTNMFHQSSVDTITNSTFSVAGRDNYNINIEQHPIVVDLDTQQRAAFERDQRQKLKQWLNASD
ncbi:hypothetical protein H0H92_003654 [Tricholoma furcatifolium]|nr:hypothetical protein H0H92_003654 [Tricholoma furcatifolium]